jgi:two-component sensor histidine kinase
MLSAGRTLVRVHYERAAELEARLAALRAGFWLGWLSIAAVVAGLALALPARHPLALLGLAAVAAGANAAVTLVPWRRWLTASRGQALLDLWSGGLVAFVSVLVIVGGAHAGLDLLLFLIAPFLATVHGGRRRVAWLASAGIAYLGVMAVAPDPLEPGAVAMRVALLAAATTLAVALRRIIHREAVARAEASARAELERALLAESHHRVKNSLQTVADILLLGRPTDACARTFDETAERIQAIAAVHRLLAERGGDAVSVRALLEAVTAAAAVDADLDADERELDPTCAQQFGIVANELIANAARHGRPPVRVRLHGERPTVLAVMDAGDGPHGGRERLGLRLVRQIVEGGLGGTFTLSANGTAGTCAEVRFDPERCAS